MSDEPMRYNKYERARIIGSRALQISMGAPILVPVKEDELAEMGYNPIAIARLEFDKGIVPITVRRPMPKIRPMKTPA